MTDVHILHGLANREFGSALLRVADLHSWTQKKRITLPASALIDEHEFVQIEALLSVVEQRARDGLSKAEALDIVENDPTLSNYEGFARRPKGEGFDPTMCWWLIGASAHQRWRHLLGEAVRTGELELFDFSSRLPITGVYRGVLAPPNDDQDLQTGAKQRSAAQDEAVLKAIRKLGNDPQKLPRNPKGKPGVKAQVKAELEKEGGQFQANGLVFKKTWERLRKAGDIKDA